MFPTARELPGHLRLFTNGDVWRLEYDDDGLLGWATFGVIKNGHFYLVDVLS